MTQERVERIGDLCVRVTTPVTVPKRGAVVLVHGICTSGKLWHRWAERLAQRGIEPWCVDLRGHGDSGGGDDVGQVKMSDYVADVEATLDASGAQAVIGHDMGGLVAQMVAERRPLKGMALIGTVSPKGTGRSNVLLLWRELRPRYIKALLQGTSWRPSEEDIASLSSGKLPEDEARFLSSILCAESGVAAREMSIAGVAIDETKVRCPALVAASTHDVLTPPARQRMVASLYRADYVEFAQHAHFPMLEPGWERPIAVIGRWLEEAARIGEIKGSVGKLAALRRASAGSTPLPVPVSPSPPPVAATPSTAPPPADGEAASPKAE